MYSFVHDGKAIGPNGVIKDIEGTPLDAQDSEAYNKAVEAQEIEHIKSGPDKLFLYVGHKPMGGDPARIFEAGKEHYCIQTWLGTFLGWAWIGPKAFSGFQSSYRHGTYRRPVTVRMFGILYHGWYYQSSGDYCRLKKAKKQEGTYAASLFNTDLTRGSK